MKENSTTAIAAVIAVALAGLTWVLRLRSTEGKFEVVEQRVAPFRPGAELPYGGVEFRVKLPQSMAERNLSIKVVDKAGKDYPVEGTILPEGRFTVPIGYDKPVVEPRVEAFSDTKLVATHALASFPAPQKHSLPAEDDPRFRLSLRKGDSKRGQKDVLELTSASPIPKGETWEVQVVQTDLGGEMAVNAENGGVGTWRLPLPYPNSTGAVKIRVTKYSSEPRHEDIPIDGMILVQRHGQTGISVPEERTFPNRLGLKIRLPKQETGPNRPTKHEDLRLASVDLQIESEPGQATPSAALVSPRAEELGLKVLSIGAATSRYEPDRRPTVSGSPVGAFIRGGPGGPPQIAGGPASTPKVKPSPRVVALDKTKTGPFRAVIRLATVQREELGSFEAVLNVHPGQPLPPLPPPSPMSSGAMSALVRPGYKP